MKRRFFLFASLLFLMLSFTAHAASTAYYANPSLSFSGTTAHCSVICRGDKTTDLSLFRCIANLLLGVGLLATLSPFFIVLAIAVGIAQYFLDLNFIKQKFNYSEEITPIIRRTEYYKSLFYRKASGYYDEA